MLAALTLLEQLYLVSRLRLCFLSPRKLANYVLDQRSQVGLFVLLVHCSPFLVHLPAASLTGCYVLHHPAEAASL
jgi:hypothetical protein